ncbi:Uncharacterised protein [Rhodococcus rhodochrous]|nr:Uncharacterised protein [Rhodococcus rhodochrous]
MPDDLLMRRPDPSDASVSPASDPSAPSVPALPAETLTQVAGTAARSRSESTRRNYAAN